MGKHAFRGMVSAWLGLIVLQAVGDGGSGRVAGLFGDVNRLVKRAIDPSVPAIPDRRNGSGSAATAAPPVGARQPDGSWPSYNVPAPGAQNWPSFNVPVTR